MFSVFSANKHGFGGTMHSRKNESFEHFFNLVFESFSLLFERGFESATVIVAYAI